MSYGVKYYHHRADACLDEAVKRAERPGHLGFLFRFEDRRYSEWDSDYDTGRSTGPYLELYAFAIKRHTPCGYRLFGDFGGNGRWVSKTSFRRYACNTIDEALKSFIARKIKQANIHQRIVDDAKEMIRAAEGKGLFA